MKSEADVQRFLRKLRQRYQARYVRALTSRAHQNCVYNKPVVPLSRLRYSRADNLIDDHSRPDTVRVCTHGSDLKGWNGDVVCDTDDVSMSCPLFSLAVSVDDANKRFESLLKDDKYVFDNYRDMATLQWVLDVRVVAMRIPLWRRVYGVILRWLSSARAGRVRALPPSEVPKGLWDVDSEDS